MPTAITDTLKLPNPRHAKRLPKNIGNEELARIRQAAFNLPQVVKPADFIAEHTPGFEEHLDGLGLVLLQKAAAGARPSRWIAPELMDEALRHLDAVGTGREVRSNMLERSAALDVLGITRRGSGWERLVLQTLRLSSAAWTVPVAFRVDMPSALVWDFYRTGDKAPLLAELKTLPPFAHAAELLAHLDALVNRSAACNPRHLDSLLPRLQAECATPQPWPELKAACTRVQDRWEHRVAELDTLEGLNHDLAFQGYPDTFQKARHLQRSVTLFVGPPNSGKTHAAFERLAQAHDGAYLAPLRLLALEGRDRLVARGVACSLLTGEENVPAPGARVVSSTIEMVGTTKPIEVAVIDEAQMIFDASRGWAWTQAIVAVPANEVIIICSAYAVATLENLLRLCGERCEVRHFERKQHVEMLPAPVPISALKKGDAVVAFSRREVLMLRDQVAANGHPVSVIYGALPPEVRRREAERFAHGASHILVATDAIGMGLNLPIRRVLFSTMVKFDGQEDRALEVSEVHQIAGRAGRYGMHEEGFVGVLKEAEPTAARLQGPGGAQLVARGHHCAAPGQAQAARGAGRVHGAAQAGQRALRGGGAGADAGPGRTAGQLGRRALAERTLHLRAGAGGHAHRHAGAGLPGLDERPRPRRQGGHAVVPSRGDRMEQALRACTLWLWLDLRFPGIYGHVDAVVDLRMRLNDGIERHLKGKKPLSQTRGGARR
jgi:ATP-dependent RNA helicase SUPV3L1/SUV3